LLNWSANVMMKVMIKRCYKCGKWYDSKKELRKFNMAIGAYRPYWVRDKESPFIDLCSKCELKSLMKLHEDLLAKGL